jgi:hypothetical protein
MSILWTYFFNSTYTQADLYVSSTYGSLGVLQFI